ncbi:MAG: RusA family crossover junction endodeoxyribonuclease [Niveispirillum sp.]|nr:RusA family crossover junction endodeoxyribonuclease [Niveispirillum sp.]
MSELALPLPLEVILFRKPISLQGSATGKQKWQSDIRKEIRLQEPEGCYAHEGDLAVSIYYFTAERVPGDIDNIVKPILDAMCRQVYIDDRQIVSLQVHKYEPQRSMEIRDPTATLATAMTSQRPAVYISVNHAGEA